MPNFGILWADMADIAQLSGRGTVTLPASLRRKLGLSEGDVFTVRLERGSIVLTPAVVTEVELYTDDRIREFGSAAEMSRQDLPRARQAWGRARRKG